jgi:hypothetical protein
MPRDEPPIQVLFPDPREAPAMTGRLKFLDRSDRAPICLAGQIQ